MLFTFIGGGHIGFCANRPLEAELNLLAMVFENIVSILITMQNFKKLVTKCTILHNYGFSSTLVEEKTLCFTAVLYSSSSCFKK